MTNTPKCPGCKRNQEVVPNGKSGKSWLCNFCKLIFSKE